MDITTRHTARARLRGESQASLEHGRGAVGPVEHVWEDEIPEDVFYSVTGVKASEAAFWQVQEIADTYESSYYDTFMEIMEQEAAK